MPSTITPTTQSTISAAAVATKIAAMARAPTSAASTTSPTMAQATTAGLLNPSTVVPGDKRSRETSAPGAPTDQGATNTTLVQPPHRPSTPPGRHDIRSMVAMFQQHGTSTNAHIPGDDQDPTAVALRGTPELQRSKSAGDPHLLLGYNPTGQLEDVFPLPCQTTLNKVAQSHFVDLWHFTKEGIAAGYNKNPPISTTGNRLMDQLGTELVLPKMPLELFNNAQAAHIRAIKHSARQQILPEKAQLLYNKAEIWEKAYSLVIRKSQDHGWASMAIYMGMLRQQYYLRLPGEDRFNPGIWQPKVWESVLYVRQQNQLEGRLPYQSAQGMIGSLPSYGAVQSYGMVAASPAYMGFPEAPFYQYQQAGPSRTSGSGSGSRSSKRGRGGGGGLKPFQSASQGSARSFGGVCIICGQSNEAHKHDFKTCSSPPPGRSTPSVIRNSQGHLLRASDHGSICMSYNRGTCQRSADSCWPHECSLCSSKAHGAQQCPTAVRAALGVGGGQ
ncbi:hypothetical protein V8E36_003126 [Tilletia maclaganii]